MFDPTFSTNAIQRFDHVISAAIQKLTFHNSQESSDKASTLEKAKNISSNRIGRLKFQANKEPSSADLRHYLSNALTIKKSPPL